MATKPPLDGPGLGPLATPAAHLSALRDASQSLQLGLDDTALQRLLDYLALLQRWNQVYNLTALRDAGLMLNHHLLDCLAVLPALRRHVAGLAVGAPNQAVKLLDVGSGGGLPGAVLAIAQPDWQVDCVDAVAKKAGFVRQVALDLRLPNLQGLHARVETLAAAPCRYDLIISRAFASLADFARLSAGALSEAGVWAAMKGKPPEDEQANLPPGVTLFHVEPLTVPGLDARRCLVWMRRQAT